MPKPVTITNPMPGGQSYTTEARARQFVRRGIAVMDDDSLTFIDDNPAKQHLSRATIKEMRERAGMVFWNGDGPILAMHRPGEIRS